jgi:hypothetical protein
MKMRYKYFKVIIIFFVLTFSAWIWSSSKVSSKEPGIYKLLDLSSHTRYEELLRTYAQMSDKDKAKGETLYLVGYAYMQIRNHEQARPYLQAAIKKGFNGFPQWTSARSLLTKIKLAESLRPPFLSETKDDDGQVKMRIYGSHTEWINYVISATPLYLKRAEDVFGKQIPLVDFYLFATRYEYDEFFKTMFDGYQPKSHQDGTGDNNMVVFCQIGDSGKIEIPAGSNRALGNVLHEYSHCLCRTIYGDNYLKDVPQWLDEGIADYVAEPYFAEQYKSYEQRIKTFAENHDPPSYKQMCRELHKDPDMRYAIGCMMVRELVAEKGELIVASLMETACQVRDFNKAITQLAGCKPELLLQKVVRKYWPAKK